MKLLAIMKKEFQRFFRDPRLIISMLLPGIVIYLIYSVIGGIINEQSYHFQVLIHGESAVVEQIEELSSYSGTVELIQTQDIEGGKVAVQNGEATALLIFSEHFDDDLNKKDENGVPLSSAQIFYDSSDMASSVFYQIASSVLSNYQTPFSLIHKDFSVEGASMSSILSGVLPFLVIAMVFSSCMGVTLESIAGEKERGTLATILVTPVRRISIALGKTLPLGAISLLGAISSFLGIILSLPKLMGLSVGGMIGGLNFGSYLSLFFLILSIVPVIVSAVAAISTFARSVKEASAYTSIVMIILMLLSLVTSFVGGMGNWVVAVPILNSVIVMQGVLAGSYAVWMAILSVFLNLVYASLLCMFIAKMLSSEKIMFGK